MLDIVFISEIWRTIKIYKEVNRMEYMNFINEQIKKSVVQYRSDKKENKVIITYVISNSVVAAYREMYKDKGIYRNYIKEDVKVG